MVPETLLVQYFLRKRAIMGLHSIDATNILKILETGEEGHITAYGFCGYEFLSMRKEKDNYEIFHVDAEDYAATYEYTASKRAEMEETLKYLGCWNWDTLDIYIDYKDKNKNLYEQYKD